MLSEGLAIFLCYGCSKNNDSNGKFSVVLTLRTLVTQGGIHISHIVDRSIHGEDCRRDARSDGLCWVHLAVSSKSHGHNGNLYLSRVMKTPDRQREAREIGFRNCSIWYGPASTQSRTRPRIRGSIVFFMPGQLKRPAIPWLLARPSPVAVA